MNQFEYVDGQRHPSHPSLLDHFAAASDHAVRDLKPRLNIAYGPHPRQTLDLFNAPRPRRATVAYYHAGFWQSRDKSGFRFLAPALVADGFDVAMVNYPLSPETDVAGIVEAAAASLGALASLTDKAPLVLVGHSAGAQIVVELAMGAGAAESPISGVLAISGVFDLEPLIGTSVNEKLGLDSHAARAVSPLHRVVPGAPQAMFACGALETPAFRKQTADMAKAWADAGNAADHLIVPEKDHFSILEELRRDGGSLRRAIADLAPS